MTSDDVDMLVCDAMLAFPWLGELSDHHRTQLISRMRTAMNTAISFEGSKPETRSKCKGVLRTQQTLIPVIEKIGETQFTNLVDWMYGKLKT